ncbi:MAG: inositol monophosphatase [Syntrophales bacterium]|nr:inositol monophosphatase [Syntrophales bacterium]
MRESYEDALHFAVETAAKAGGMLRERLNHRHRIEYKGEIDIVTEADRMSEEIILAAVRQTYPHHDVLTEESAGVYEGSAYRWIVDPLDGTTNYAHGYPVFCVSLALEHRGEVVLGVVYNPMLEEMFSVIKGCGARLNGEPLRVSRTEELARCLLATGFPYDIRSSKNNNLNYFIAMATKVQAIRRAGSAALDLAYVAAGRFDGFWELKLKPWDMAAGCLLVVEAGGMVSDLTGGPFHLEVPGVVATNGLVHGAMIDILSAAS